MKVLIIPEDPTYDQHLLKPLLTALFNSIGKNARVRVCQDPVLGGRGEALKPERIGEIVERYTGMTDIFILCVDRDGPPGPRKALNTIEASQANGIAHFLAQEAWEEIETWALAGLSLPTGWRWREVRREVQVKETYFEPLVAERGLSDSPGRGRKRLGAEAARNMRAIRKKCPEDFGELAHRLEAL